MNKLSLLLQTEKPTDKSSFFYLNQGYENEKEVLCTKPLLIFTESGKWLQAQYVYCRNKWFDMDGIEVNNVSSWTDVELSLGN